MANLSNLLPPGNLVTAAGAQTLSNKTITEMLSVRSSSSSKG